MADCIYWNMKSQFGKSRRSDNKKMWEWQSVELTIMEKTGVSVCICIFICVQIQFVYIYIQIQLQENVGLGVAISGVSNNGENKGQWQN